jgi:pyruvate dehydrogenase E2 component (dihydrolipoamide acetyltransferase)
VSEIVMPRLSDSMEEGTILKWLKADGDAVSRGDPLAEIETDKATLTYEADAGGVLTIVVAAGETLPIGTVIARLDGAQGTSAAEGGGADAAVGAAGAAADGRAEPASSGAVGRSVDPPLAAAGPGPAAAQDAAVAASPDAHARAATARGATGRVKASPLARRIAREQGVDLRRVAGTGPGGRVVKVDVEDAARTGVAPLSAADAPAAADAPPPGGTVTPAEAQAATPGGTVAPADATAQAAPPGEALAPPPAQAPPPGEAPAPPPPRAATASRAPAVPDARADSAAVQPPAAPAPPPPVATATATATAIATAKGDVTVQELTRIQQVIARRMAESKATVPEFTLRSEIDMEGCVRLRAELKELGGDVPSYNDMVVKASALALREFPRANGSYRDGHFELHSRVNVGVAVAAPDALVVPTIFDADRKSLREITRESRGLAERVRAGTVTPPELSGGTFSVSNLGMYGVSDFTAVINPPQAAILAVGALAPRAVVRHGELVARHTMGVTLACDHRILYGADAAQFLARIRALLEQPLALAF